MKILVFFGFITLSGALFSQVNEEIIFNPDQRYNQNYLDSVITSNLPIRASTLKKILESDRTLKGWIRYYNMMSNIVSKEKKFDSVIYYADLAINKFEVSKIKRSIDEKILVAVYNLRGYALTRQKDFNGAMKSYQAALDLEKTYPYKWKSYILDGLGSAHLSLGNDSIALGYYQEAVKDSNYLNIPRAAVSTLTRIGQIYDDLGKEDLAINYYENTLRYSFKKNHFNNVATLYGMIGIVKYKQDSIVKTINYFNKAINAYKEFGPSHYEGEEEDQLLFNGFVNVYQGDVLEGVKSLRLMINRFISLEKLTKFEKVSLLLSYETLGEAYKRLNNLDALVNLNIESRDFLEKFYQSQQKEELLHLELKYQTKEKDASIAQLQENEVQQQTIIKQQRYLAFGLVGLLLLLSGFGYLFWKQRKLKNQYEKENLEQRLLRSQMNPHFIGNAMNTVSGLVEKNSKETIPFINKLSTLFRLMLTNSREELVSLNEELVIIKNYLELQSNFSQRFEFHVSTEEGIDLEEVLIPPMLIQPLVENAILHGLSNKTENAKITVEVAKDVKENLLKVMVNDNGSGFDQNVKLIPNKMTKSISGSIIKERLQILKKKFKVNTRLAINSNPQGTKVELYLPYIIDV